MRAAYGASFYSRIDGFQAANSPLGLKQPLTIPSMIVRRGTRPAAQHRTTEMKIFRFALWPILALFVFAISLQGEESLDQTINFLINRVRTSDATFVRNGATHTSVEAAAHIQAKYDHFKKEIKTPEDFIRLSASKSLLTGKPYLIRPTGGKEMHLDIWLLDILKQHRTESHS